MISHPEFGDIQYLKIYLQIDEDPELFICKFDSDQKYIGIRVEAYSHPVQPKTLVHNLYFAPVSDEEIAKSEKDPKYNEIIWKSRSVWFLNYLRNWGDPVCRWKKETKMNPMYELTE